MSNWNKARAKYSRLTSNFSSFDGSEMKSGFAGQAKSNFIGQRSAADGSAAMPGADMFSKLEASNQILTVVIQNTQTTGSTTTTAVVFGAYQYSGSTQENTGVSVDVLESSHAQVRAQSINEPFWVIGLRLLVSNTQQLAQTIQIQYKNPSGDIVTKQFRPLSFRTASQNQSDQIDAPNYSFGIDGSASMRVPMLQNTTATITLLLGGRWNASKAVDGASPLSVGSQTPLNTGLVTIVQG